MKFRPGTPRDVMDQRLAEWKAKFRAEKEETGKIMGTGPERFTPGPGSTGTPKRGSTNPEYGSAIGRGGMTTMQFMDSDGDNVDDRFQRGPGQPRESGQPGGGNNPVINKSPGKPIINREVSQSRDSSVMKFKPGTPPEVMQAALTKAGYPDKISGAGTPAASPMTPTPAASSPATPTPAAPPRRGGGGRRAGRREGRRQAGMNFGLMPTEVIEQTRGRGYGLTYQPQQRTGKQIKFGGGGPQNVINFNPIMSQQANPNIRIGVGGSKQISTPTQTSSPVQESGPGSVYTGPNQGNFEEGPGNQTNPTFTPPPAPPVLPPPPPPNVDPGTEEPKDPKEPKKPKNKYRRLMERYMRRFDRTAHGAGSSRGTDRFSAKDIRMMTKAGNKFGGRDKQVARDVLQYAKDYRGITKMGGTAKRQLDKLQDMLGGRRKAEKKAKSKAAKKRRQRRKKQSRKKSRARAKAKAKAFKKSRRKSRRKSRKNRRKRR